MLYITIPKGMKFKKINENGTIKDCFVCEKGNVPPIELQLLIKEALRQNTGRNKSIRLKEFTIYLRAAPDTEQEFLAYELNRNGKKPTASEPKIVIGHHAQKYNPARYSGRHLFWQDCEIISKQRIADLEAKREQQRENRRHYGDSPLST